VSSSPVATQATPPRFQRGDRVLVRARNFQMCRWRGNRQKPLEKIPAVVDGTPTRPTGHYWLRSELIGGFAALASVIELDEGQD
jgi:hypothetical protein